MPKPNTTLAGARARGAAQRKPSAKQAAAAEDAAEAAARKAAVRAKKVVAGKSRQKKRLSSDVTSDVIGPSHSQKVKVGAAAAADDDAAAASSEEEEDAAAAAASERNRFLVLMSSTRWEEEEEEEEEKGKDTMPVPMEAADDGGSDSDEADDHKKSIGGNRAKPHTSTAIKQFQRLLSSKAFLALSEGTVSQSVCMPLTHCLCPLPLQNTLPQILDQPPKSTRNTNVSKIREEEHEIERMFFFFPAHII